MRKAIIAGNWKMNNTVQESLLLVAGLERHITNAEGVEVVVAPPYTSLYSVGVSLQDSSMKLAAQNIYWEEKGAYTGEISGTFLKDVGCDYVIVGHSERRKIFGETDEAIAKKVEAVLRNEMIPIFCIGETLPEREDGITFKVLESQIKLGLSKLHAKDAEKVVIAYEPVWAIGTGKVASAEQIKEAHHFIHNTVSRVFDGPTANAVRILYGGSVTPDNSETIFMQDYVDGALVGGASLKAETFAKIVAIAADRAKLQTQ